MATINDNIEIIKAAIKVSAPSEPAIINAGLAIVDLAESFLNNVESIAASLKGIDAKTK